VGRVGVVGGDDDDDENLGYDDEDVPNDALAGVDCDHLHFEDDAHVAQDPNRISAEAEGDAEQELEMGNRWQDDEEYEDDIARSAIDGDPSASGVYDENEGRGEYDDYPD
jgi:hypothetical protein